MRSASSTPIPATSRRPSNSATSTAATDKFEEAAKAYSRGIATITKETEDDWRIYYYRGVAYERSKQWPQAEADFQQALKLNPNQPQVLNYLGYSWVDMGINLDKALAMIKAAVDLRPNDGYIVDSLGWAYYRLGKYSDAVETLERAVELKPEDSTINDHLGDAYWQVGRKREALFQWAHARDLDPEKDQLPAILDKLAHGLKTAADAVSKTGDVASPSASDPSDPARQPQVDHRRQGRKPVGDRHARVRQGRDVRGDLRGQPRSDSRSRSHISRHDAEPAGGPVELRRTGANRPVSSMDEVARAIEEATGAGNSELACAKINLALHVGGRRPDGYHNLESLVVFADLADAVTARPAPKGSATTLNVTGPFAELLAETTTPAANLALRAAEALARVAPKRAARPTHLTLAKRIPVASGLGGGSADAAATLRLLEPRLGSQACRTEACRHRPSRSAPTCRCAWFRRLWSRAASAKRSRRSRASRPCPSCWPTRASLVSTASVFAGLGDEERQPLPPLPAKFGTALDLIFWLRQTRNDLTDPARALARQATAAALALSRDPDCLFARMSGSGATAFGIFVTSAAADRAAKRIRQAKPNWWVTTAMTRGS